MLEQWHDFFVAQAGASAALAGLMFVALSTWLLLSGAQTPKQYGGSATGIVLTQIATLPAVCGAVAIVAFASTQGVYAIAFSLLMSIVVGILNSWVLLVEILR